MRNPQQIHRKLLPPPLPIIPVLPRIRKMPKPGNVYESRAWINAIPTPRLETHFPTTYSNNTDTNCQLIVQQTICNDAGEPSQCFLRVLIEPRCEEMMLRAMLNECPAATTAW